MTPLVLLIAGHENTVWWKSKMVMSQFSRMNDKIDTYILSIPVAQFLKNSVFHFVTVFIGLFFVLALWVSYRLLSSDNPLVPPVFHLNTTLNEKKKQTKTKTKTNIAGSNMTFLLDFFKEAIFDIVWLNDYRCLGENIFFSSIK